MKKYKTLEQYEKQAQIGDKIVLGGRGIIDGIETLESKHDVYTVKRFKDDGSIVIKAYRGKTPLVVGAGGYDQEVAVLKQSEFKKLPVLY